ncbi:hypothetical protein HI914_00181 [Erysiphe necator]|uniref:Putative acyl-n-acyltransferase protein n=1 Tax=Uncinula necator TaxID=52586 RepID=A0A0B1P1E4_UNCNE|nr:hypothetical protein HI914_00181 [Erysiphe necator]KHJ32442.1 putative acyl- n-acyltransferase protein [Erysiphe necator]
MTSVTTSDIKIRHAELKDVESICEMLRNTFTTTFGHTIPAEDLKIFLEDTYNSHVISAEIVDPATTSLVAEDPTQPENIIGLAQLLRGTSQEEPCMKEIDKAVEIHRIYVDTNFHKRGVGTRFMNELEQIAKDESFPVVWLGVDEYHPYAQDFYIGRGYKRVGRKPFKMGNCIQYDWVVMKQL